MAVIMKDNQLKIERIALECDVVKSLPFYNFRSFFQLVQETPTKRLSDVAVYRKPMKKKVSKIEQREKVILYLHKMYPSIELTDDNLNCFCN